jgi:hypothetical protein
MTRAFSSFVVALLAGAAGAAIAVPSLRAQAAAPPSITPIVAQYTRTDVAGRVVRGTLQRASDGSIRLDVRATGEIQIVNVADGRAYFFDGGCDWQSRPLTPEMQLTTIAPEDARGTPSLFEGRRALTSTTPDGGMATVIPDLQFLVVERTHSDGSGIRLQDVRTLQVSAPDVFRPPAGARVVEAGRGGHCTILRGDQIQDLPAPGNPAR